jgi:DNA-binding CsgD family transcriptional regulator
VIPTLDPAFSILTGILDVVPASAWSFARIENNRELSGQVGSPGLQPPALAEELRQQRLVVPAGSRIAATLRIRDGFASGITLIFADAQVDYGIFVLLREETLPPYSSIEISILTLALEAGTDRLAAFRLQPLAEQESSAAKRATRKPSPYEEAFYVLDHDMQIVLAWNSERQRRIDSTGESNHIAERLPPILEESVRKIRAGWSTDPIKKPAIMRPVPFLVVRAQPMTGPDGLFVGVHIDRFRPPNSLTDASMRFRITPREVQVLAMLLDGDHLHQISHQLKITSSTVQDHIKSMLVKTESRNRSEMIARILGWESPPNPHATL